MKLEKETYYHHKKQGKTAFARLSRYSLTLSCIVRDWILPHRFVKIDIDDSKNIILTPTNSTSEYCVSVFNGQARITACALLNLVPIEEGKRIPCERLEGGAIICRTG